MAPFAWIFAIVAGSIILIFILRFSFQGTEVQETILTSENLQTFELNLELISQTKDQTANMQLPQLEFPCILGEQSIVSENLDIKTERIIFSRPQQGNTWIKSKEFSYPYPITNVIFLSKEPIQDKYINLDNLIPSQRFYTDDNQAKCIKTRLINKIKIMSSIYAEKARQLKLNFKQCSPLYTQIITEITNHKINPTQKTKEKIENLNTKIAQQGCAKIW